ncbi:MAG: hypothetical protein RR865_15250, partial [Clostridia bacterium]
ENVVGTPYMVSAQLALSAFTKSHDMAVHLVMMTTHHTGCMKCTFTMVIELECRNGQDRFQQGAAQGDNSVRGRTSQGGADTIYGVPTGDGVFPILQYGELREAGRQVGVNPACGVWNGQDRFLQM